MNHQDFDNHLNRMFRDEEEHFETQDHVWDSVATRLEADQKSERKVVAAWWQRWALPLAAALFLLSNCAWWSSLKSTRDEIIDLKSKINTLQKIDNQQVVKTKTIERDTIYKTIFVTKYIQTKALDKKENEIAVFYSSKLSVKENQLLQDTLRYIAQNFVKQKIDFYQKNTIENDTFATSKISDKNDFPSKEREIKILVVLPILKTKPLVISDLEINIKKEENTILAKSKPKIAFDLRQAITPISYSAEGIGGVLAPIRNSISKSSGVQFGFNTEANLNKHWSILLGGSNADIHYFLAPTDSILGLPKLPPPSPDYSLIALQANNSLWQIHTGLKRYFIPNSKINPYLSMSYTWQGLKNLQAIYEFRNAKNEEIKLTQEPIDQTNYAQYLTLGAGFNYRFYKKWSANFGINYQQGLNKQIELPNLISTHLGIGYRF